MAYARDGYPTEFANKVGHIKLIQDPTIQRLIESFEDHRSAVPSHLVAPTGNFELEGPRPIEQVITVDGGHQAVPNAARPERQVGFIQVAAQMVKMETIERLRGHPMADPPTYDPYWVASLITHWRRYHWQACIFQGKPFSSRSAKLCIAFWRITSYTKHCPT